MKSFLSQITGKKILITGGSGYIATSIISSISRVPCTIYRISNHKNLLIPFSGPAKIFDIEGDITVNFNWSTYIEEIDLIFHLGAQTSTYKSNDDPVMDMRCNVIPALKLLLACKKSSNHPMIIFTGTVTEIGLSKILPVSEEHYEEPITIYDIHKLLVEKYIIYFSKMGYAKGAILRLSNVYGPGPKSSALDRGILNMMIAKGIMGETLKIYGSGSHIRDYIFIDDVVEAFIRASVNQDRLAGLYFIIGSGKGYSISDAVHLIAKRINDKTGRKVKVEHINPPVNLSPIECRNFIADISKFSKITNWKPKISLKMGIDKTIDYFIDRI